MLRQVTGGAPCGGDLLSLWPSHVRERLRTPFASFGALRSYLESNAGQLSAGFSCADTGRSVAIDLGAVHCGGNPCKDWSLLGKRQGVEGPTAPALITWALLIRRHKPDFLIQENVLQFPIELLLDLLGGLYRAEALELDPRRLGWPVARRRRYVVLTWHPPSDNAVPLDALRPLLEATSPIAICEIFAVEAEGSDLLSERELLNLTGYERTRPATRGLAYDLSQNPELRPRGATEDGSLCTVTCSSSRLYLPRFRRCLSGRELLLAQGFPAHGWAAQAFGLDPTLFSVDDLSNHAAVRLAGNAMHSNCMGLVMGWALVHRLLHMPTQGAPQMPLPK